MIVNEEENRVAVPLTKKTHKGEVEISEDLSMLEVSNNSSYNNSTYFVVLTENLNTAIHIFTCFVCLLAIVQLLSYSAALQSKNAVCANIKHDRYFH